MSKTNPDYVLRAQLITQVMIAAHGKDLGSQMILERHLKYRDDGRVFDSEIADASLVVDEIIRAAKR
ncbi:MAG TPA: hypothetical protein VIG24_08610 [Acidimicrobiia bacterium]